MNWQDRILQYIEETKDFLLENAPSFFSEIAAYGRAKSILVLILLPIFFISGIVISYKASKEPVFGKYADIIPGKSGFLVLRISGWAVSLISFIVFMTCVDDSLMCWFAPKLYIIRQITGGK